MPAPANDNFAGRIVLSGVSDSDTYVIDDATTETGEQFFDGETAPASNIQQSVWYEWTAPNAKPTYINPVARVGAANVSFWVTVWQGSVLGSLTMYAQGVPFQPEAGETYLIQIVNITNGGPLGSGTVDVALLQQDPPANDDYADAETISGSSGVVSGTTSLSTFESGEPNPDSYDPLSLSTQSVWYEFTPPSDGDYHFRALGTGSVPFIEAYTSQWSRLTDGGATGIGSGYALYTLDSSTTYRIRVAVIANLHEIDNSVAEFDLHWNLVGSPPPPAYDNIEDAFPLVQDESEHNVFVEIAGATYEGNEESVGLEGIKGVWLKLDLSDTALYFPAEPVTIPVSLDATGTAIPYLDSFRVIDASFDPASPDFNKLDYASGPSTFIGGGTQHPSGELVLTPNDSATGIFYLFIADSNGDEFTEGGLTVTYTVPASTVPAVPANDSCANAQALVGCGGTIIADNRSWDGTWPIGADPLFNAVGEGGGAPLWYRWTNEKARPLLFRVRVIAPPDHPTDYNFGLAISEDCAGVVFYENQEDVPFNDGCVDQWAGEGGTYNEYEAADDFSPFPTSFDVVVEPGHSVFFEIDSWTGDTSEPPTADPEARGKFKFEWSALEFTTYDSMEGANGPCDNFPQSTLLVDPVDADESNILPYATLILDGTLFMLWGDNQDDGNHVIAGSCALDGSSYVMQDLGQPGSDRAREPQLFTDGTDVFIGFWSFGAAVPNPGYTDSCAAHAGEVYLCSGCSTGAFPYLYHVYKYAGGGAWDLLSTIANDTPLVPGFVPDVNGDVTISTDSSIAAFTVCSFASAGVPGKVYVHAAYRVTKADQSLHFNDYPLSGGPGPDGGDAGSLWCTNDRVYVVEYVDTYEIDASTGDFTRTERQTNEVGELSHWVHDSPNINPAFGEWQTFADGDLVTDPDTPRDSIIYSPNGLDGRSDEGYPLVALCRADHVDVSGFSWENFFENQITLRRLDTFADVVAYTFNDFTLGFESSTTRYASIVRMGERFTNPDTLAEERSLGGTWVNEPPSDGSRSWTDRIGSDGLTAPVYIVGDDPASSSFLLGWLLPDTLVTSDPGGRQWWGQIPFSEESIHHYDYCDPPGWRQTWIAFHGSDGLPSAFLIPPYTAYDVANDDFYFVIQNSTLRKAHVLRDYLICEPGAPCAAFSLHVKRRHYGGG